LGAGLYYDEKVAGEKATVDSLVKDLDELLLDPAPNVRRAACLALVAIGNRPALESVADALLSGDDELRQAAAEALANHPEEGYPTLREGMKIDDIMVRRSVIYGLQRVNQPWAVESLQKIQIEEEEWLVQNAATHALETMALPNPYLPRRFPPLTETAWLIEFAGKLGIGVSPGRPAVELLLRALQEGSMEQALAAMEYLRIYGDELAVAPLFNIMANTQGEIQDEAFNTLWHLAAAGVKLPAPSQVFSV
jgi:HEAT repeat protein